jgi:hypothetical protein
MHLSPTPNNFPNRQTSPPLKSLPVETTRDGDSPVAVGSHCRIWAQPAWSRRGSWPHRPGTSGTLDFSRNSPESCLPTTARMPPKPMYSGRAIWRKRGRSYTATNLPGFPPRSCKRASRKISAANAGAPRASRDWPNLGVSVRCTSMTKCKSILAA